MPQLTSAATNHGLSPSSLRCAYHANVMNTLLSVSRVRVSQVACMAGASAEGMRSMPTLPPGLVDGHLDRADAGDRAQCPRQLRVHPHRVAAVEVEHARGAGAQQV